MASKTPPDKRDKLWAKLEKEIQQRAENKEKGFVLKGKWKRFVRVQDGFKVYAVDGTWIRNNLSVIFGHGGHGLVHEFIPMDEIWVSTHHYSESRLCSCGCSNAADGQEVSRQYFDSTVIHEIVEFIEMKKSTPYWKAHNLAIEQERKAGLLKDSYIEVKDSG